MYKCKESFTSIYTGKTYREGSEISYDEYQDLEPEDAAYFVDEDEDKYELQTID